MIEVSELKGMLKNLASRADDLSRRIGEGKTKLNAEDSQLCRQAVMGRLDEMTTMLKIEFYSGNVGRFDHLVESINEDFGHLMLELA